MKFKVGDLVTENSAYTPGYGKRGRIIAIENNRYLVDFYTDVKGHSGGNQGSGPNTCWWCLEYMLSPHEDKFSQPTEDAKTGEGKPDWTLLSYRALEEVVKVLEFGGKKYPRDSWKRKTGEYKQRYQAAAQRHLAEIIKGNAIDPESKLPHAAHLLCNAMFLTDFELDESYRENL